MLVDPVDSTAVEMDVAVPLVVAVLTSDKVEIHWLTVWL